MHVCFFIRQMISYCINKNYKGAQIFKYFLKSFLIYILIYIFKFWFTMSQKCYSKVNFEIIKYVICNTKSSQKEKARIKDILYEAFLPKISIFLSLFLTSKIFYNIFLKYFVTCFISGIKMFIFTNEA